MLSFLSAALLVLSTPTLAAVISEPHNLFLVKPDASDVIPNILIPPNRTISEPSNTLPPSPYVYPMPFAPSTKVIFSAYSGPINQTSTLQCILAVTQDVETALEAALRDKDPGRLVPFGVLRINAKHASLIITSIDDQMKWTTCGLALKALMGFLNDWEYVGLKFVVWVEEVRVAVGVLAAR